MAVTATTHSKPIGWSRSDVIDLIEQAHTTVGANTAAVSGLIAGIKSHTYGGENTQRVGLFTWDYYYDVRPSAQTGTGTGASFEVHVYNGKVKRVSLNRAGRGYANGDVLTLNDLDFGGNGSNGVQDINVTVYVEGYATGGSTYTLEYDSANNLTGVDANGAVNVQGGLQVAGNITIAEGDTLLLKGQTDYTYIMWYDFLNDTSLNQDSTYDDQHLEDWSVNNVVNQGALGSDSDIDSQYLKWKPAPGQAGTYYIRQDDTTVCVHTITVVAASQSSVVLSQFGAANSFYDKQARQAAVAPWGVCRREIDSSKVYGYTYQMYQFNEDVAGQVEINIVTGSDFSPQSTVLPNSYTINSNARVGKGHDYDYQNDANVTYDDRADYMYDARFKGDEYFDRVGNPRQHRYNDSNMSSSSGSVATARHDDHGQIIADRNAYNAYSLDLISYQSGSDPNFVVYSFKQPNLSSTKLRENSFMTWFVHDYTSPGLFDYDHLFLGGVTVIYPNTSDAAASIKFRSFFGGQHNYYHNTSFSKRNAEFGFLPVVTNGSYPYGRGTDYVDTDYGSTSLDTEFGSSNNVHIYTRSNLDHTYRSVGGDYNNDYAQTRLPNSTNFNAVIKGIPLSAKVAPVPYYLPNDFAMIDFDVATPAANIQQGDTITVSASEIYTVITGSYEQTDRTRGILFCARTT